MTAKRATMARKRLSLSALAARPLLLGLLLLTAACAAETAPQDLREIQRAESPNDALACPLRACKAAADIESPVYAVAPEALMQALRRAIEAEPRTELAAEAAALNQAVFVQRSAIFRFPDTVWVQSLALSEGASVIIYSRSNYGYGDFGVNLERVERWLARLEESLGPSIGE